MPPRVAVLLEDIRDASPFISDDVTGQTFESYRQDRRVRQLVERNFMIVGEAMVQLSRLDPVTANRITDRAQIIAFRNALIHAYSRINHVEVWRIIHESLPTLMSEVEELLREQTE